MSQVRSVTTRLVRSIAEVRDEVQAARAAGEVVGLVPTMGALHAGHLSLVDASLSECDRTVVSIFVNPSQFGPGEDFACYPRELDQDFEMLADRGCWMVFAPEVDDVYPTGYETVVDVGSVAAPMEGTTRPVHFRGVATVVLKLLQMVPADRAYFGQKDYQQSLVIKQLVRDLNLPVEICVCPIVRESDGLAMSSRNAYLSPEERLRAKLLWRSLELAAKMAASGEVEVATIRAEMIKLFAAQDGIEVDYIAFVEDGSVREVQTIDGPTVVAVAARVGNARLIDNRRIG